MTSLALAQPRSPDQWYAQGQQLMKAGQYAQAAQSFQQATNLNPSAANWRWLGEALVQAGDLSGASSAFEKAIQGYRARGDSVTARALEARVAPYRQEGEFYLLDTPGQGLAGPQCARTRAKFEPESGLLMGMYVDEAGLLPSGQLNRSHLLNADYAVYFRYFKLVNPAAARSQEDIFPTKFVNAAKRAGGAVHIAVEPGLPLRQVTAATVTPFAKAAGAAGLPIFLRFAGEFNDPVNEWSRDPALYRAKFRLVHDVMARYAPNVAMVWMPMPYHLENLDAYYPGADAVDWVGASLYAVPFRNGDTRDSAERVNPLDVLKPLYDKYSCAHPIQVSEFASSHYTAADPRGNYAQFAADKLRTLYWGALLKYPRIKNINWLNIDMIGNPFVQARERQRQNDYSLLSAPEKLSAYRELLQEPYFATRFQDALNAPRSQPLPGNLTPKGNLEGALWLKTFDQEGLNITLTLDGRAVPTTPCLPYRFTLSGSALGPGTHTLSLTVRDASGKLVLQKRQAFTVQEGPALASAPAPSSPPSLP